MCQGPEAYLPSYAYSGLLLHPSRHRPGQDRPSRHPLPRPHQHVQLHHVSESVLQFRPAAAPGSPSVHSSRFYVKFNGAAVAMNLLLNSGATQPPLPGLSLEHTSRFRKNRLSKTGTTLSPFGWSLCCWCGGSV